jgi:UDP-GlcNAc:undecaprenyl-phosphate GlcNAc-1-phosphate transferase
MNSVNMLDNMDAITSSVSTMIFGFMVFVVIGQSHSEIWFYLVVLVSAISSVGSFLIFNWHPSKMYMGDNGSMFLGALLSIAGILFIWNMPAHAMIHPGFTPLLLIWLLFTVPITDTTTVSINRLLKGNSPFVGGKDHTTHFLSYLGFCDRSVALIMIGISAISLGLASWLVFVIKNPTRHDLLLFAIWPALVFIVLYSITKIVKPKEKRKNA